MIPTIIMTIAITILYIMLLIKDIHIFQLEEYKNINFIKWALRNKKIYIEYIIQIFLTIIIIILNNLTTNNLLAYSAFVVLIVLQIIVLYKRNKEPLKKKFKSTARVIRIICMTIFLFILEIIVAYLLKSTEYNTIFLSAIGIISIINIIFANIFLIPIQNLINLKYINEAKKIINKRKDLIVIGITGSYGKTSTKFILQTILSEKYNVIVTPNNFNTTLGNVRTIRENLNDANKIYISEMGARKPR